MFCLLVVLVELSVLAKWLAWKTPLRKPNRGEGIDSRKPRPKSAHDFLGSLYCFIVLLCICVVSCPYMIYYPTIMARYSLFVLKVPLNPKQTNNYAYHHLTHQTKICSFNDVHFLLLGLGYAGMVHWSNFVHMPFWCYQLLILVLAGLRRRITKESSVP